jgi:hypothetical protein
MPTATSATKSRRVERSAAARGEPTGDGPARRANRASHVIDRALVYHDLAARHGLTTATLAKRVRRSKGYVSLHLRLAAAIVGMEPAEQAAMRHPAITWRLVQRVVRGDTRVQTDAEQRQAIVALRQKLRDAVGGFSSETVDRRRHRKGRAPGAPLLERFDPRAFATDPAQYVAAHLDALVRVHEAVARQALQALDLALARDRVGGLSLTAIRRLSRADLAAVIDRSRVALTPEQEAALDALSAASRILAGLRPVEAIARAAARAAARSTVETPRPAEPPPPTQRIQPPLYEPEELEADLAE